MALAAKRAQLLKWLTLPEQAAHPYLLLVYEGLLQGCNVQMAAPMTAITVHHNSSTT